MQSQKVSGRTYETGTGLNGTLGVENKIIKNTAAYLHLSSWMGEEVM